jgi:hypothetical protein
MYNRKVANSLAHSDNTRNLVCASLEFKDWKILNINLNFHLSDFESFLIHVFVSPEDLA